MSHEPAAVTATTIVVHDLTHARAALAAAEALGRPVVLVSAPGAGGSLGAPWFLKVVALAAAEHPGAAWEAVLDCADKPGYVLAALRQGAKAIGYSGPKARAAKLAALAEHYGARLVTGRIKAHDLRDVAEPEAACRAWIGGED